MTKMRKAKETEIFQLACTKYYNNYDILFFQGNFKSTRVKWLPTFTALT